MEKKETGKSSGKRAAKDLPPRKGQDVGGGAFNAFVNFGDIKGESTDKDHRDWVR